MCGSFKETVRKKRVSFMKINILYILTNRMRQLVCEMFNSAGPGCGREREREKCFI